MLLRNLASYLFNDTCNQGCGAGAQAILDGRSQKFLGGGAGAGNLSSGSKGIVCGAS